MKITFQQILIKVENNIDVLLGLDVQGQLWKQNPETLLWESISSETN